MFKKLKKRLLKPRVLLIRHGSTDFNSPDQMKDRVRGWIDIPLNAQGIKETQKTCKELHKLTKEVDIIYCSDLIRAQQTALECNSYNAPIILYTELRPCNLGIYEGKVTANVLEDLINLINNPNKKAPNGESFKEFSDRFLSTLSGIIKQAKKENKIIVVVTHLRNLKLTAAWLKNKMKPDYTYDKDTLINADFEPAEILEVPL